MHRAPMEERRTGNGGDSWSPGDTSRDDDMRRVYGNRRTCFPNGATANDGSGPAARGGVVSWRVLELCARPDDEVLRRRVVLEPVGELVARFELGPV